MPLVAYRRQEAAQQVGIEGLVAVLRHQGEGGLTLLVGRRSGCGRDGVGGLRAEIGELPSNLGRFARRLGRLVAE